jgi:hypothetical protein
LVSLIGVWAALAIPIAGFAFLGSCRSRSGSGTYCGLAEPSGEVLTLAAVASYRSLSSLSRRVPTTSEYMCRSLQAGELTSG